MIEDLEIFASKVEGFYEIKASEKIVYFVYFLLKVQNYDGVEPKDIAVCFDLLHLDRYSNIPSFLNIKSKGKHKIFLKKSNKYHLERATILEVESTIKERKLKLTYNSKLFPVELFDNTRQYLKTIALQAIAAYENAIYDGASVLIRKLIEILIIECFECHKIEDKIINKSGDYYYLSDLISILSKEEKWMLSRNVKKSLPEIKAIGDLSAHNRRFIARKGDLDKISKDVRIVIEELIHIIDYPNWKNN